MAKFAAQLKDRFLGLVERVAGCGRGAGDKGVKEPTKLSTVQVGCPCFSDWLINFTVRSANILAPLCSSHRFNSVAFAARRD